MRAAGADGLPHPGGGFVTPTEADVADFPETAILAVLAAVAVLIVFAVVLAVDALWFLGGGA